MNVYNQRLQSCSSSNTALTGYTRNGKCEKLENDIGSHHVCLDINTNPNFCTSTGQDNWCSQKSQCHDSEKMCDKKDWCVCQWAFSSAVDKIGCDNLKVNCDATNINVYNDFRDNPNYKSALDCLRKKCQILDN